MKKLLHRANLKQQEAEMQTLENKMLKDQVQALAEQQQQLAIGGAAALDGTHVAGAAHKAVRQAAR